MRQSSGERAFITLWRMFGGPEPVAEYRFHRDRRWRFDFAWPDVRCAVEIDGGAFTRGRHTRGKGFEADLEKMNEATLLGWRVFRFTPQMLSRDPVANLQPVIDFIREETLLALEAPQNEKQEIQISRSRA